MSSVEKFFHANIRFVSFSVTPSHETRGTSAHTNTDRDSACGIRFFLYNVTGMGIVTAHDLQICWSKRRSAMVCV
jgi:hypothetical protein